MRFYLTTLVSIFTAPIRFLFKVLIEFMLPEAMKETIVLTSLYALLKNITDPCTMDVSKLDKEILDLHIIPDAIKLPVLCAPYIWASNISYIQGIKANLAIDGAGLKPMIPYAKELYNKIPFYLRSTTRKVDMIAGIENIIRITCGDNFVVYGDAEVPSPAFHFHV